MAGRLFRNNANITLPSLATLQAYDSVLAYTNSIPNNTAGLGDLLADYVDGGGHLVLATYAYSSPWAVAGRITTSGYTPLLNLGVNDNVSGDLVPTAPADPIFSGVDFAALTYFENANFAHPGLDIGATLLATDGAGVNMIARNPAGNVVGLNLFPSAGAIWIGDNSPPLYQLFANALTPQEVDPVADVPEPATLAIWAVAGAAGLAVGSRRRRRQKQVAAVARTG